MRQLALLSPQQPISIHMQESPEEALFFATGEGAFPSFYQQLGIPVSAPEPGSSSLQTTLTAMPAGQRLLLVHNTCATAADLEAAATAPPDVFWCLCPGANRYIENRLPDVALFRRYPDRVLIGTDSLASNDQLSILNEIQQLLQADPDLTPAMAIQWACGTPARFLGWTDLGTLEPGKRPGLLHIHPGRDGSPLGSGSQVEVMR
jgi:cytosine/adenosine deaminase-related metal-dependent hydrolase